MPLTDPERDFIDHYALEAAYPQLSVNTAHRQIQQRHLDEAALLRFAAIRGEEWQAWGLPYATLDFRSAPKLPDRAAVCPWANQQVMWKRLHAVTKLGEANALLSRDFRHLEDGGFINRAPHPEHRPVVYFQPSYEALDNWTFRGRFGGIRRGHVGDQLKGFPVSVWDPIRQPRLATRCHYLMIVEAKPEPFRVWHVTRADILGFAADEGVYGAIFPEPPSP